MKCKTSCNEFPSPKCVMIIAGETSGDMHGAKLVKAMREKDESIFFYGIGGNSLRKAGVKIIFDSSEIAVVGITEIFSKIFNIYKAATTVKNLLRTLRPNILILIDFPDFNLHIASVAKKLKIPVFYYISPQIWAWRSKRINKIAKLVNHMAVILPFEENYYKKHKIPATFVGHPLLDNDFICANKTFSSETPHVVGLLSGSRLKEIERHLPIMMDSARIILKKIKTAKFIVSIAPSIKRKHIEKLVERHENAPEFEIVEYGVDKIFERCSVVVAVSGTVTLEAAIAGVPTVIIYKVSPLSYWLGNKLIKIKYIGLANLIADCKIMPELVQNQASPENIANQVFAMLNDVNGLKKLSDKLLNVKKALGESGASKRAADIALKTLNNHLDY